jgi:hypothetical protein
MSKHKNVNPDHYKMRGSLRPGGEVAFQTPVGSR